jgi:hypothetical protein
MSQDRPPFDLLEQAEPLLLERLGHHGVERIEYTVGFVFPWKYGVWLCVDTDEQRDALGTDNPHRDLVREVLAAVGIPSDHLQDLVTTSQSQETVDREYEGSWFYALR